jgi:2-keto-3-deoxy-L-fuconate dehydrogenase
MFDLQNKTVVITGAGSGIGKAISVLFASQGATVFVVDLNEQHALQTASEILSNSGSAIAHICDITSQSAVKDLYNRIKNIDILINSAGISHIGNLESTSEEDMDRIFKVNVKGVYNSLLAAVPLMREKKKGVIVNLASIASLVGITDRFAYSMSKGAVYAMTLSVARDYLHEGIRCNSISPARVHTPFVDGFIARNYPGKEKEMFEKLSKSQPIGRMASTAEVAHLALYLCSDEASFITGCDYPIDGGFVKLNN